MICHFSMPLSLYFTQLPWEYKQRASVLADSEVAYAVAGDRTLLGGGAMRS